MRRCGIVLRSILCLSIAAADLAGASPSLARDAANSTKGAEIDATRIKAVRDEESAAYRVRSERFYRRTENLWQHWTGAVCSGCGAPQTAKRHIRTDPVRILAGASTLSDKAPAVMPAVTAATSMQATPTLGKAAAPAGGRTVSLQWSAKAGSTANQHAKHHVARATPRRLQQARVLRRHSVPRVAVHRPTNRLLTRRALAKGFRPARLQNMPHHLVQEHRLPMPRKLPVPQPRVEPWKVACYDPQHWVRGNPPLSACAAVP